MMRIAQTSHVFPTRHCQSTVSPTLQILGIECWGVSCSLMLPATSPFSNLVLLYMLLLQADALLAVYSPHTVFVGCRQEHGCFGKGLVLGLLFTKGSPERASRS